MIPGAGLLGVLALAAGATGDHPTGRNAAAEVLEERGAELGGFSDADTPSLDTYTGRRDDRPAMKPRSVSNWWWRETR